MYWWWFVVHLPSLVGEAPERGHWKMQSPGKSKTTIAMLLNGNITKESLLDIDLSTSELLQVGFDISQQNDKNGHASHS